MDINKQTEQHRIDNECNELENMVVNHERLVRQAVEKTKEYEIAYAKEWLGLISDPAIKMTVDDKKQKVALSTADLKFDAELAEELSKTMAEAIRVKLETLGAHRSILSSLKGEEDNQPPNGGETPAQAPFDDDEFPPKWTR